MRLAKEDDRDAYLCFDPSRIPALKGRLPSLSSPLRTCIRMPVPYLPVYICVTSNRSSESTLLPFRLMHVMVVHVQVLTARGP